MEQLQTVILDPEEWTPANQMLTAAQKLQVSTSAYSLTSACENKLKRTVCLQRKNIMNRHESAVKEVYP